MVELAWCLTVVLLGQVIIHIARHHRRNIRGTVVGGQEGTQVRVIVLVGVVPQLVVRDIRGVLGSQVWPTKVTHRVD